MMETDWEKKNELPTATRRNSRIFVTTTLNPLDPNWFQFVPIAAAENWNENPLAVQGFINSKPSEHMHATHFKIFSRTDGHDTVFP